jgi:hypothetical protein
LVVFLPLGLFCIYGLVLASGVHPVSSTVVSTGIPTARRGRVKILAWNLAKGFVHEGGISFARKDEVEARMPAVAGVIRGEDPDLVFLSEIVVECTPCDVDQVRRISELAGLPHWVFGENTHRLRPGARRVEAGGRAGPRRSNFGPSPGGGGLRCFRSVRITDLSGGMLRLPVTRGHSWDSLEPRLPGVCRSIVADSRAQGGPAR